MYLIKIGLLDSFGKTSTHLSKLSLAGARKSARYYWSGDVCRQKKTIIEKTNIFFREHFTQLPELPNIFQSLHQKVQRRLNHKNNLPGWFFFNQFSIDKKKNDLIDKITLFDIVNSGATL